VLKYTFPKPQNINSVIIKKFRTKINAGKRDGVVVPNVFLSTIKLPKSFNDITRENFAQIIHRNLYEN